MKCFAPSWLLGVVLFVITTSNMNLKIELCFAKTFPTLTRSHVMNPPLIHPPSSFSLLAFLASNCLPSTFFLYVLNILSAPTLSTQGGICLTGTRHSHVVMLDCFSQIFTTSPRSTCSHPVPHHRFLPLPSFNPTTLPPSPSPSPTPTPPPSLRLHLTCLITTRVARL